jgi:hypothetical protein
MAVRIGLIFLLVASAALGRDDFDVTHHKGGSDDNGFDLTLSQYLEEAGNFQSCVKICYLVKNQTPVSLVGEVGWC